MSETSEQKRQREVVEEIATNIAALGRSVATLLGGRLKRKTLLVLLANASGHSQKTVDEILTTLAALEKDWLK